ncbi:MAG: long-chain-fatty-acid--CoA ligase [Myxococcales bacterium]|nr:long-chain-fatty-acid--CoA ligase [Myxococcales bacterium]
MSGLDPQERLNAARRMSHGEQIARIARKLPAKVAFRFLGEQRTFAELDRRVTRLARALAERGVEFGDRVAVLLPNGLEIVEAYFAIMRLGAICVPINFRLVAHEVAHIARDSGARALILHEELAEAGAKARAELPALGFCLVVGSSTAAAGADAELYEQALAHASDAPLTLDVPEHAPAFIMYTSGTTGRPKGAVLSHFNLIMNTMNSMIEMGIRGSEEVWLSGLPLFHIGALNGILNYVMSGGTSVIQPTGHFDAAEVVDQLERERITGAFFVASQWQAICAVPGVRKRKFSLRRIAWGASSALPSVLQAMAETFPGVPMYTFFGQTEMSSVTTMLDGKDAIRKLGSVGQPVINVELRIVDDEMRDVPRGEAGEVVYRAPTVMQGYWNDPEATAEAFAGGWFHSGDICRMDEEGYITVVDRKKDMIISGGENIYSAEVEAAIESHPEVREVAVIAVPDPKWMETPKAVIVPRDPAHPPSPAEIIAHCAERLASYKKPSSVVIADELPRNASGKVLKTVLREKYVGEPIN